MEIKFGNCTADEVAETLKIFEREYDMHLIGVNVYFNMVKGGATYRMYDIEKNDEPVLNAGRNVMFQQKLEDLSLINAEDLTFVQMVANTIEQIDKEYRDELVDFILQYLEVRPKGFGVNHFEFTQEECRVLCKNLKSITNILKACPEKLKWISENTEYDYYTMCDKEE